MNLTVVSGHLARPASIRELNEGHRVLTLEITGSEAGSKSGSIPVCWHDPPATAENLDVGDEVVVVGRVRRRFFRAAGSTQSRTEVDAQLVIRARQRSRIRRALAEASATLDEMAETAGG